MSHMKRFQILYYSLLACLCVYVFVTFSKGCFVTFVDAVNQKYVTIYIFSFVFIFGSLLLLILLWFAVCVFQGLSR